MRIQIKKPQIKEDMFIIATIVLVALIAFGIGRLTGPSKEPVQIINMQKASIEDIKEKQTTIDVGSLAPNIGGKVLGSVNSDKYHLIDCPGAKQINEKNIIWFDSIEAAKKAGYKPAANCPGLD